MNIATLIAITTTESADDTVSGAPQVCVGSGVISQVKLLQKVKKMKLLVSGCIKLEKCLDDGS